MIAGRSSSACLFAIVTSLCVACGSSDKEAPPPASAKAISCNIKTQFSGDDTCLVAPAPNLGMQFHYGPSDYTNPDEVQKFVLAPTLESLDCMYLKASNAEKIYFNDFENHLRPGSHHMLVSEMYSDAPQEGLGPCGLDFGVRS